MFEHFEHTADLGLRVAADSWPELLVEAGRGLVAMLVAEPEAIRPVESWRIEIAGDERELLLFDWLSEILYHFEAQRLLPCRFEVQAYAGRIVGELTGEAFDEARHRPLHEVKAITYHALHVEQSAGVWRAELIVDI